MASQTCFDFSVGKCDRGDSCKFEHADTHVPSQRQHEDRGRDDRRRRDAPRDSSNRGGQGDRCYDFTVGKCDRGNACRFGHPETCYDFSIGKCDRDNCRFFHSDVHIRPSSGGNRGGFQTSGGGGGGGYAPDRNQNRARGAIHSGRGGDRFPDRDNNRRFNDDAPVRNNQRGGANFGDVCYDFTVGDCNRGTSCKFVHPETCFDASMGKCDRGDRCKFLHVGPQNRSKGKRDAPQAGRRGGDDKSRACYDFTQGRCTRGDSCKFSHDEPNDVVQEEPLNDEFPPLDFPADETPVGETCYDFSVGKCNRGDGCRFAHEAKHVPTNKRAAPY